MPMTVESRARVTPARTQSLPLDPPRDSAALSQPSELRSIAYICAAAALGGTFWNGRWAWQASDQSFVQAMLCLTCLLLGISLRSLPRLERWAARVQPVLLIAAFTFFFSILLRSRPNVAPYVHLMIAAALLIGLGLTRDRTSERWRIPLLLTVFVALGLWRISTAPAPQIDVWVWHNEALQALLSGRNPYAITMPNVFPDARYYDPSMVVDGRVLTGFQYPPLSLYFALPGYLLGDYRYSMLCAIAVAGACMAYTRPGPLAATAMALWLFSPGALYILQYGYTESMVVMLVAWTVACAARGSRWLFVPLGLVFASKQYMFLLTAPLVWLLPNPRQLLVRGSAVGALVTAPFVLINPRAFIESIVLLQLRQPFRPESLSIPGWWANHFGEQLPSWWCFVSLVPTAALALWRCERSAAAFAAALSLVSFVFFFLSKQAFANYYFFTLGTICCALALAPQPQTGPSPA
jgi:hypothetical protein